MWIHMIYGICFFETNKNLRWLVTVFKEGRFIMATISLTHGKIESMNPTLRFSHLVNRFCVLFHSTSSAIIRTKSFWRESEAGRVARRRLVRVLVRGR
jgi:hypothetical protein